jgi:hypothetical protein
MTNDQIRALVRASIERHLSRSSQDHPGPIELGTHHPSHMQLPVPSGGEIEGPCLIEPSVRCNHCGYCQSYGH